MLKCIIEKRINGFIYTKNLTEPMLKSIAKENVDKMMLTSFGPGWEELLDGPAIQKSLGKHKRNIFYVIL